MSIIINEATYNDKGFIFIFWHGIRFTDGAGFIAQIGSRISRGSLTNIFIHDPNSVSCQIPYIMKTNDYCTITLFAFDKNDNIIQHATSATVSVTEDKCNNSF
ncbi:MAG: hypothetical protein LBI71_06155 [Enterobacteriaceae bacterium]|jgi:hypothetical protein|nr:hypothetical protein [Enterobacteriaceae bacterium]